MSIFYTNIDIASTNNTQQKTSESVRVDKHSKHIKKQESDGIHSNINDGDGTYELVGSFLPTDEKKETESTDCKISKNSDKIMAETSNYVEEDPYEVLSFPPKNHDINKAPSISEVKRTGRNYGDFGNCGLGMRESMIGFKEGVPGIFSGFKANLKHKRKSAPDLYDTNFTSPQRPPRSIRPKSAFVGSARIYDLVDNHTSADEILEEQDILSDTEEGDMDIPVNQSVLIDAGVIEAGRVETGVRYYDPSTDLPRRPSSAVVLPMSLADDMSDSGDEESWGSDFEDSVTEMMDNDNEIYEVLGEPRDRSDSDYEDLDKVMSDEDVDDNYKKNIPPLPPRRSIIFETVFEARDHDETYIPVEMDDEQQPVILPPLPNSAEDYQVKRYQIIKCIIENEKIYMKALQKLIKEYEEPLIERKLINHERCRIIFMHVHEILQCHQLFNMGLAARMNEWNTKEVLGDVMYASFSKSTVLKAYSSFVSNFPIAMDSIKETCKLVPAFLKFLKVSKDDISEQLLSSYRFLKKTKNFKTLLFPKLSKDKVNRLYRNNTKQSLYDLMRQPLERIPQLVILIQALVKVTPLEHEDRSPLLLALTHLECLSETLAEKRKDSMCKHKVRQLDSYCTGLEKPLSSKKRYYIRHDDMLLCLVEDSKVVKTKLRRIFILNDLLICTSILNKQKQLKLMTKKKYKVKWCIPINDVSVIDVGSGISINVHDKTTTIKYSHPISSPRPGGENASQILEDLQHDIAIIGEIAGKVAQLRKSYRFLDSEKVNNWYKDVKNLLDHETEMANMHWIELSIPVRGIKDERLQCLFNVHSPNKKIEWTAELENVKLRLHDNNNPGWYLQEESAYYEGETAVLRRTQPLVTNVSQLFMIEAKYSVQCVLPFTSPDSSRTTLWVFSGNEHLGLISLMEMNMTSQPHVIESFIACQSRICCAELVEEPVFMSNRFEKEIKKFSIWVGTMSGSVLLYDPEDDERKPSFMTILKDAVVSLKYALGKMFAGLANGTVACFRRRIDCTWDLRNPTIICLGTASILSLTVANQLLWCACGSEIIILDTNTLGIVKKITADDSVKGSVKHLIAYGTGVWISVWKSSKLQLYHAETLEPLQSLNITTPIARMKNDIDGRIQNINIDKIYATSLLAKDGLLWVGVNQGLIVTYPLPRLGGIPRVSGQARISFHTHDGPVKHLITFQQKRRAIPQNEQKTDKIPNQNLLQSKGLGVSSQFLCGSVSELSSIYVDKETLDKEENEEKQPLEPVYFLVEPDQENESPIFTKSKPIQITENKGTSDAENEEISENVETVDQETPTENNSEKIPIQEKEYRTSTSLPTKLNPTEPMLPSQGKFNSLERCRNDFTIDPISCSTPTASKVNTEVSEEVKNSGNDEQCFVEGDQQGGDEVDSFVHIEGEATSGEGNKEQLCAVNTVEKVGENNCVTNESGDQQVVLRNSSEMSDLRSDISEELLEKPWSETQDGETNEENPDNHLSLETKSEIQEGENNEDNQQNYAPLQTKSQTNALNASLNVSVKSKSDSGYELPTSTQQPVTDSYAIVDKKQVSLTEPTNTVSDKSNTKGISEDKQIDHEYGIYRSLPLPVTPVASQTTASKDSFYMPLAQDPITNNKFDKSPGSSSLTSTLGFQQYERDTDFDNSLVRETDKSDYAPLVAVSKRDADNRRERFLEPSYVVSVGVGHIDLRKKMKSSGKNGFDFIRSFSNATPEHLLISWKLC